jgi:adenylate cyclase, class 2
MDTFDKEIKVLEVKVEELITILRSLGAKEVFNGERVVTHFDDRSGSLRDQNFKLTEEDKLKLSISSAEENTQKTIKLFVSRKEECLALLKALGIEPVTESRSRRISFEWSGIDFDLDQFPNIPPFLEIDLGDSGYLLEDILQRLNLTANERVEINTPTIYKRYGLDYFELFGVK